MRFRYLDLLRGIAACAVMFYHSTNSAIFGGLYIFVDLFFVLSGFVLEPQLTAATNGSKSLFIKRRIVRIWPLTILS
ncbi:MAG: acyltransferase family protein, partial [Micrococcales bacterium]